MNWSSVAVIVAALIAGACAIVAARVGRDVRRNGSLPRRQIEDLQADLLTLKRLIFTYRAKMADAGIRTPELPRLRSEEWEQGR